MATRSPSILIVDDDEGLTRLIARALTRNNLAARTAFTGEQALERLKEDRPDLMLLDLKLPDIETAQLLDRMAGSGLSVPFVVITGQGDERVAVEMMKRGALDYLVKDAQFLEFVPIVVNRTLAQLDRESRLAATEDALRREHEFSMAVLKAASTLMVVADAEGHIVSINPACERMLGRSIKEVESKDFARVFLGSTSILTARRRIEEVLSTASVYEQEASLTNRSGERRLIAWSISAQHNDKGAVEHLIASGMDITERRRLEREILEVSDREQKRIGQDLHDGLCQVIAGINMLAVVLKNGLSANGRPEAADAEEIAKYASKAVAQARLVSRGLAPVELETHGLMAALEEMAASTEKLFKVKCQFVCPQTVLLQDNAKAIHLYRIAQEATSNAIKHGQATTIQITLSHGERRGTLSIIDDGNGMPERLNVAPVKGRGMGLRTMDYRAAMIGATLSVKPARPHGTEVFCSFPID